jgi:hypothetical protein
MVVTIFGCLFLNKDSKESFFSMKSLDNNENPFGNSIQETFGHVQKVLVLFYRPSKNIHFLETPSL